MLAEFHRMGGDPTTLGWGTTVAYLIAATCCVSTGLRVRSSPVGANSGHGLWLVLGLLLLGLGLNKQWDFHSSLIHWIRDRTKEIGLYEFRRYMLAAFFAAVVAGIFAVIWWQRQRLISFAMNHYTAAAGIAAIALYIILRFAAITHVEPESLVSPHDSTRFGFLELLGNALVSWSAVKEFQSRADD